MRCQIGFLIQIGATDVADRRPGKSKILRLPRAESCVVEWEVFADPSQVQIMAWRKMWDIILALMAEEEAEAAA
jgi:hypothetical protein